MTDETTTEETTKEPSAIDIAMANGSRSREHAEIRKNMRDIQRAARLRLLIGRISNFVQTGNRIIVDTDEATQYTSVDNGHSWYHTKGTKRGQLAQNVRFKPDQMNFEEGEGTLDNERRDRRRERATSPRQRRPHRVRNTLRQLMTKPDDTSTEVTTNTPPPMLPEPGTRLAKGVIAR